MSSTQDLDLIFNKSLDEFEKSQTKIIEHVNDFFSPINYDEILNVLNTNMTSIQNNMNLSVVVPTKNRPTELRTFTIIMVSKFVA